MKREAQVTAPTNRGRTGHVATEVLPPPGNKKPRCNPREENHSLDIVTERLMHLNSMAIQCLQNGEWCTAQGFLLNALDLIKVRRWGKQTTLPVRWSAQDNADSSPGFVMLDDPVSNDGQVGHETKDQALDMAISLPEIKGYDEGFRASMEPLQFSTAGHLPSQQAAIIYYNVGISFLCFQKPKGARHWFGLALICFEDGGVVVDPSIMARLHCNIGFCLWEVCPERALKAYRLAFLIATRSSGLSNGTLVPNILNAVGVLQYRMGQHESALFYLKHSLGHFNSLDGKHQEVATVTHNIGRVHLAQRELGAALSAFEQVLALRRRHRETSAIDLAASLCSVGSTLEKLGRDEEALEFYAELVDWDRLDASPVDCSQVCSALANIYRRQGNQNDALQLYEKAVRVLGGSHPVVTGCLIELAECNLKDGNATKAIESYKTVLALEQRASEKTHLNTVNCSFISDIWSLRCSIGEVHNGI
jgi:tetratricopeptide (TPR) repeat protein